jgi:hypothetical protein
MCCVLLVWFSLWVWQFDNGQRDGEILFFHGSHSLCESDHIVLCASLFHDSWLGQSALSGLLLLSWAVLFIKKKLQGDFEADCSS